MGIIADLAATILIMLVDWPLGTIMGILILLMVLMLVGLFIWGLFTAADSWFLPRERGPGRIAGKSFTPAHYQPVLIHNAATNTSMPYPVYHPDDWSLRVEVEGRQDSISVGKKEFKSIAEGDNVIAEYVRGRLSGGLYLKSISYG